MTEPSAVEIAADIAAGKVTALAVTEACLARIAADEPRIQAFAHLDPEHARAQARALDERKRAGRPLGPLHGVPVAVKDIVDTADFPTEHGSVIHAGRRPLHDAAIVARLRAAGAVLLGKTVTTEFACFTPGKTRNPHDLERTPGGSSSGSAAAVAAGMAPLAIGSQTNGSVIRPASFCGVVGFKPSYGLIPRTGVLTTSATLDHVGVFARSVEDAALLADALAGFDDGDPATRPGAAARPAPRGADGAAGDAAPRLRARPDLGRGRGGDDRGVRRAGRVSWALAWSRWRCPSRSRAAVAVHRTIWTCELAFHLAPEYERGRAQLSDRLRQLIEAGLATPAPEYQQALATRRSYQAGLDALFHEFDAIVTPAAPGEAPVGLDATGSPAFCTLWSLAGTPAVSLPILQGPAGLPLGVQLVGAMGDDARLLRTARWLVSHIAAATEVASG